MFLFLPRQRLFLILSWVTSVFISTFVAAGLLFLPSRVVFYLSLDIALSPRQLFLFYFPVNKGWFTDFSTSQAAAVFYFSPGDRCLLFPTRPLLISNIPSDQCFNTQPNAAFGIFPNQRLFLNFLQTTAFYFCTTTAVSLSPQKSPVIYFVLMNIGRGSISPNFLY